jgi:hypothetical protein
MKKINTTPLKHKKLLRITLIVRKDIKKYFLLPSFGLVKGLKEFLTFELIISI